MEAEADLEADVGDAAGQLDGMGGRGAELLRQFVSRVAARGEADVEGDLLRVEIEAAHDAQDLGDLVLMIEGEHADAVGLERQADIRLRLDRVHVEELGLRRDRAHRRELAGRRDIEAIDAGGGERLQHDRLAVGLHRIGGAAGKRGGEGARILGEHARAKAIDRHVRPQRVRGIPGGLETLHRGAGPSLGRFDGEANRADMTAKGRRCLSLLSTGRTQGDARHFRATLHREQNEDGWRFVKSKF